MRELKIKVTYGEKVNELVSKGCWMCPYSNNNCGHPSLCPRCQKRLDRIANQVIGR